MPQHTKICLPTPQYTYLSHNTPQNTFMLHNAPSNVSKHLHTRQYTYKNHNATTYTTNHLPTPQYTSIHSNTPQYAYPHHNTPQYTYIQHNIHIPTSQYTKTHLKVFHIALSDLLNLQPLALTIKPHPPFRWETPGSSVTVSAPPQAPPPRPATGRCHHSTSYSACKHHTQTHTHLEITYNIHHMLLLPMLSDDKIIRWCHLTLTICKLS